MDDMFNIMKKNRFTVVDVVSEKKIEYEYFCKMVNSLAQKIQFFSKEIIVCENNSLELLLLYFSGLISGKVIIPIDPEKEAAEINLIRQYHNKAEYLEKGKLASLLNPLDISKASEIIEWDTVKLDSLYLITYTSGSTGNPKGVKHTARNLFLAALSFADAMNYDSNVIMGHCMPMTYMAGILNTIFLPFIVGGTVVILPRFSMQNAFAFWKNVKMYSINTLWLSPTMLRIINMIDRKGEMKTYFHDCKMKISIGTAPLDYNLRKDFEEKYETRLYQSYGLSETLFISTEVPEEEKSIHSVGHILDGVDLIFAEDREIIISVPWMFLGYTNADTSSYMKGSCYLSGDLGVVNGENLIINGRKKDLIVKGGYNINPRDIENIILENNLVKECVVISVDIKGEESIICCFVKETVFNENECNNLIVSNLGKHCRVDVFVEMSSLPKNVNGKLDKIKIKEEMEKKYVTKD